jgi:hypothetical protein
MTVIMASDGQVAERDTRIRQLEQLNATLAAQVDRMRPVIEAAGVLASSLRRHESESWSGCEEALERAVTEYKSAMAQLAREG